MTTLPGRHRHYPTTNADTATNKSHRRRCYPADHAIPPTTTLLGRWWYPTDADANIDIIPTTTIIFHQQWLYSTDADGTRPTLSHRQQRYRDDNANTDAVPPTMTLRYPNNADTNTDDITPMTLLPGRQRYAIPNNDDPIPLTTTLSRQRQPVGMVRCERLTSPSNNDNLDHQTLAKLSANGWRCQKPVESEIWRPQLNKKAAEVSNDRKLVEKNQALITNGKIIHYLSVTCKFATVCFFWLPPSTY